MDLLYNAKDVVITDPAAFGSTVDTSVFAASTDGGTEGASNHMPVDDMEEDEGEMEDEEEDPGHYTVLPE